MENNELKPIESEPKKKLNGVGLVAATAGGCLVLLLLVAFGVVLFLGWDSISAKLSDAGQNPVALLFATATPVPTATPEVDLKSEAFNADLEKTVGAAYTWDGLTIMLKNSGTSEDVLSKFVMLSHVEVVGATGSKIKVSGLYGEHILIDRTALGKNTSLAEFFSKVEGDDEPSIKTGLSLIADCFANHIFKKVKLDRVPNKAELLADSQIAKLVKKAPVCTYIDSEDRYIVDPSNYPIVLKNGDPIDITPMLNNLGLYKVFGGE